MSTQPEPSRRDLLGAVAAAAAGMGLASHALLASASLSPRVLYEPPTRRKVGLPSRFPKDTITYLPAERIFILRGTDDFRALSAVCTHLGCTVEREGEGFHCACHGSRFAADGTNESGPALRPLPWRPLARAPDGSIVVDLAGEASRDDVYRFPEKR